MRYVSANAASLLGEDPQTLLGQGGRDWLEQHLPDLTDLPSSAGKRLHLIGALDLGCGELDVLISPNSAGWILEFEPTIADEGDPRAHRLLSVEPPIDAAKLRQLQHSLVEVVSAVTGYDRTTGVDPRRPTPVPAPFIREMGSGAPRLFTGLGRG